MPIMETFTKKFALINNGKLTLKKRKSGMYSSKSLEDSERFTYARFCTGT